MVMNSVNEVAEQPAPAVQQRARMAAIARTHRRALALAAIIVAAVVLLTMGLGFVQQWSEVKVVIVNPLWEDHFVAVELDGEWIVDRVSVPANETMTFGPWSVTAGFHHLYYVYWNESLVPKNKLYDSCGHKFCLLPFESKTFALRIWKYTLE
jgi:hypothetical protein